MKKIAYIINSIRNNGPSNVVINLIDELDRNKYKIYLITIFDENEDEILKKLEKKGVIIKQYALNNRLFSLFYSKYVLSKFIRREDINIIHSNGFIPDIVCSILK